VGSKRYPDLLGVKRFVGGLPHLASKTPAQPEKGARDGQTGVKSGMLEFMVEQWNALISWRIPRAKANI